jgi:hypothetical protein
MSAQKKRLQFDFTLEAVQGLKALAVATGVTTTADVVRHAISLYAHLGPAMQRGAEVIIREQDGRETKVILAR